MKYFTFGLLLGLLFVSWSQTAPVEHKVKRSPTCTTCGPVGAASDASGAPPGADGEANGAAADEEGESTLPIWCNPHKAAPWRSRVKVDSRCKELAENLEE